ncbi:MAG: hypothetical protein COV79_03295, partial [Parcubacteria group bacterium CG11_big_fil_rev_8_21_14_0_20_41_14]
AWSFARPERDGARRGSGIFQQENIRDLGRNFPFAPLFCLGGIRGRIQKYKVVHPSSCHNLSVRGAKPNALAPARVSTHALPTHARTSRPRRTRGIAGGAP